MVSAAHEQLQPTGVSHYRLFKSNKRRKLKEWDKDCVSCKDRIFDLWLSYSPNGTQQWKPTVILLQYCVNWAHSYNYQPASTTSEVTIKYKVWPSI